jgi:tRNA threonylcarbamoyl adenosine modification protein (Sua5/YciO/YrdC/YwlC family)
LPTDTVFAFVTIPTLKKSVEKLYALKDIPTNKPLSLYCRDFSQASEYIKMENNSIFRWMKNHLPGPYTLVFQASKSMPQYTITRQKTVGIRIVDHPVVQGLLSRLDVPLIGTSVFQEQENMTYAEQLDDQYGSRIAGVVNTGPQESQFSTVLNMQSYPPEVIREGKGSIAGF